ncbi:M14 family metallopeptidase [Bacillus sp. KH172YL63]|uniref:M14 family metallopeptidase n=1 Tax=Bacillus sp. KH172YL63 TaxID=2709784 RepID=UPI0013E45276|nr:M14 family metallopeptidase [Bacillus sp. KH172YL63]BCB02634.1 hypothetical protein KH172YL63_07670 [Bacillus sp. KH172YL63]
MKKPLRFLMIAGIIGVLIEWVIPYSLLQLAKPDKEDETGYYIGSYEESKNRFSTYEEELRKIWKDTRSNEYPVGDTGLAIDVLTSEANQEKENLLIFTTGVHGIEGYVGSAMLDVFKNEYVQSIDPDTTGVIFVHSVNPWGMKNERRYNEENVDLNRNFIEDWDEFNLASNKDYIDLADFFQRDEKYGNMTLEEIGFYSSVGYTALSSGTDKIEQALLTGQYSHPEGVYYGGAQDEPSTIILKGLYEDWLKSDYENIVHIDLHTGYGPKYQMSIFSSSNETMTEKEAEKAFQYPLVFTPESEGFYVTKGDNTEYFHQLAKKVAPEKQAYSTTFEFGTLGDGTLAGIQSLHNTIDENQVYWNGSSRNISEQIVHERYKEMFYPSEAKWRKKAVEDFRAAVEGVLGNKGILHTN